ncbi:4Fe-4S binding protein [Methanopyrus sp. SNP6]|uniref:4Fe-4S binding protein n=1 Tax=Methanopyrus sp. SNP6 TaxID=1937005 RepID=UPI001438E609|nr:4Fe-4S binding protein [Methanopyrus sp. SNP6]
MIIEVREIVVIHELCRACGLCEKECPTDAIEVEDSTKIDEKNCVRCGLCVEVCPFDAILLGRAICELPKGSYRIEVLTERPEVGVRISESKCVGCQACSSSCPVEALSGSKGPLPKLDVDRCIGCLECVRTCPSRAIEPVGDSGDENARNSDR